MTTIIIETPGITTVITEFEQGPPGADGIQNISAALDVSTLNKLQGSLLVYSTANEKWIATNQLENQNIDAGTY